METIILPACRIYRARTDFQLPRPHFTCVDAHIANYGINRKRKPMLGRDATLCLRSIYDIALCTNKVSLASVYASNTHRVRLRYRTETYARLQRSGAWIDSAVLCSNLSTFIARTIHARTCILTRFHCKRSAVLRARERSGRLQNYLRLQLESSFKSMRIGGGTAYIHHTILWSA